MDRIQQKKLYLMNEYLRELHSELDFDIQSKIPLESLVEIANVLGNDETIFQIIQKLMECQNATEKILKNKRDEHILSYQQEIEEYSRTLSENELNHTLNMAKIQHEKKMKEVDKQIISQLDETLIEQQQTLGLFLPGFIETQDKDIIKIQMNQLFLILKLHIKLEQNNFE